MSGARQSGFTLLEVLIGIVVLALIATALFSTLRIATRSVDVSQVRSSELEELRLVSGFLTRRLGLAMAVKNSRSDAEAPDQIRFSGDAQSLAFVADLPSYVGIGGLHDVALSVVEADEGDALKFRQTPVLHSEPEQYVQERTLVEALQTVKFSYFGAPDKDDEPQWHDAWQEQIRLPALVKVELESERHGTWPPIVVQLRNELISQLPSIEGGDEPLSEEELRLQESVNRSLQGGASPAAGGSPQGGAERIDED